MYDFSFTFKFHFNGVLIITAFSLILSALQLASCTTYGLKEGCRFGPGSAILVDTHTSTLLRCASLCDRHPTCLSFEHSEAERQCRLSGNHVSVTSCNASVSSHEDRNVYDMVEGCTNGTFINGAYQCPSSLSQTACPNNWVAYKGHCYLLKTTPKSQFDAGEWCESAEGGAAHLVYIDDAEENAFITSIVSQVSNVWTGMGDFNEDGRFTFVDQRPLTYTNWALGSPDSGSSSGSAGGSGSANTNCIGLIASASTWKDRVCSETLPFVCEISPGSNAQSDEF